MIINKIIEEIEKLARIRVKLSVRGDEQSRLAIINIIVSDVWRYLTRHSNDQSQIDEMFIESDKLNQEGLRLVTSIAQRRIADHFRQSIVHNSRTVDIENIDHVKSDDDTQYRSLLRQEMILDLISHLTLLSDDERSLLLRDIEIDGFEGVLTSTERKRLSRLRGRIRNKIEQRYGDTLTNLLDE